MACSGGLALNLQGVLPSQLPSQWPHPSTTAMNESSIEKSPVQVPKWQFFWHALFGTGFHFLRSGLPGHLPKCSRSAQATSRDLKTLHPASKQCLVSEVFTSQGHILLGLLSKSGLPVMSAVFFSVPIHSQDLTISSS